MHAHIFGDLLVCSEGIRQRNSAKSPELHRHTITNDDLTKTAEETFFTRLRIKQKLGYSLENERFPKRAFETPTRWGKWTKSA